MSPTIHPTAIVDAAAVIAASAVVGPYCLIGAGAVLGENVVVSGHVSIAGDTRLAEGVRVHPHAVLGEPPQIYGAPPQPGRLEIGAGTVIREHATVNLGSPRQDGVTRVGAGCMLMVGAHIGHDCTVGDQVIMANNATLGGHVVLEDQVFVGGLSAIHQRVRVGSQAFIGGMTGVEQDVIPYGMVTGDRGRLEGLNIIGMKRRGFTRARIHRVRAAYRALFLSAEPWTDRLALVQAEAGDDPDLAVLLAFLTGPSPRGIMKARRGADDDGADAA